jgi:hypothetical protein
MDVIGQGREPERDSRPPLPRHWRVAGWALAVAAVVAVIGLGLRHGTGSPDPAASAPTAPATWAVTQGGSMVAAVQVPSPVAIGGEPVIVNCSPSTGACSVRLQGTLAPRAQSVLHAPARAALRAPGLW